MGKRFSDSTGTWTDDDARTLLEEWRQSGDSIAAFARRHSVSAWRLYSWRKKLRATPKPRAEPTLSLVPASIVTVSGVTLTLRLPGEVSIDVANPSPSWVATLVAELTRPSS
jgi:transposase-like protein